MALSPDRVRAAFSLRTNAARLFVPPASHARLGSLDGLRALSVLWVILFHAAWYARFFLVAPTWLTLFTAPWMVPLWRGDFGVDVFFVLSGFLIGGLLEDERVKIGGVRLGRFYARRALRLWPALLVVVAVKLVSSDVQRGMVWANVLYVNDFLPVLSVTLGWTWSLAIEEQFYLVCPWLLRALAPLSSRRRVVALGVLVVALAGVAVAVVTQAGLHAWDAEVVANIDTPHWARAFDILYDKPWMRAGALLAGVAAAVVYRTPAWMAALGRGGVGVGVGAVGALVLMGLSTHWPLAADAGRALEVAYLASFRTTFGVAVAFVLLVVLSPHPLGRALAAPLSSRVLYPVAQLAYPAYLVNPLVTLYLGERVGPFVDGSPMALAVLVPCDLVGTLACAAVIHLAVERPFMELRPR